MGTFVYQHDLLDAFIKLEDFEDEHDVIRTSHVITYDIWRVFAETTYLLSGEDVIDYFLRRYIAWRV